MFKAPRFPATHESRVLSVVIGAMLLVVGGLAMMSMTGCASAPRVVQHGDCLHVVDSTTQPPQEGPCIPAAEPVGVSVDAPPLAAIAVTQCGLALSLFVQLDATHMLRTDPRQSDIFAAVGGHMSQKTGPSIPWDDALALALRAPITSHVVIPCDGDQGT